MIDVAHFERFAIGNAGVDPSKMPSYQFKRAHPKRMPLTATMTRAEPLIEKASSF